jgi:hypothetical protein
MAAASKSIVIHLWSEPREGPREITMLDVLVGTTAVAPGKWIHQYSVFGTSDLTVGASTTAARQRANRFLGREVTIQSDREDDQKPRLEAWLLDQMGEGFVVRDH